MYEGQSISSMLDSLRALAKGAGPGFGERTLKQLVIASTSLADTLQSSRGAETPAARSIRLDANVKSFVKKLGEIKDETARQWADTKLGVEGASKRQLNLEPNRWAQSVVNAVAGASQTDRTSILNKILEKGDGASLAALQDAPEFVTGISAKKLNEYQHLMETKHAPEVAELRSNFERHSEAVFIALGEADRIGAAALDVENFQAALDGEASRQKAQKDFEDSVK